MKRAIVLSLIVALAACSSKKPAGNNRDTMTQRQKDSVFGANVPGGSAINKAQTAADSLNAQRKRTDSIAAAAAKPDTGSR